MVRIATIALTGLLISYQSAELTSERATLCLGGIKIGMSSGHVVAKLGQPIFKSRNLAGSEYASGRWDGVSIFFAKGKAETVWLSTAPGTSSVPEPGSPVRDVIDKFSGTHVVEDEKTSTGFSKVVPALGLKFNYDQDKITYVELSGLTQSLYDLEQDRKTAPDYGIELVESTGESRSLKDRPREILSATVRGRIRNVLDRTVSVEVTVVWRERRTIYSTSDRKYLNSETRILSDLRPGELRKFSIECSGFVVSKGAEAVYSCELKKLD